MLDRGGTALVLIDLQKGIVALPTAPRSGQEVVRNAARLAERFRANKLPVILVRVAYASDFADAFIGAMDAPAAQAARPPDWSELVPEIGPRDGDIVVIKRQWGAFYGTDLDLQLRRRGVKTIVLGGIATNMGVESTARSANEHGYHQVFVEDAMTSLSAEMHAFAITHIFPRIGRVRSTDEVLKEIAPPTP